MSAKRPYEGGELQLFASAHHWKSYWASRVRPHLGAAVLEVGAGLGTNTPYLLRPAQRAWLCLEPDPALAARIPATLADHPQRGVLVTRAGMLRDLGPDEAFDTILYIDVLEHIEDDHGELRAAFTHLAPGGKIVVLSPAHPWLFNEFDRALGHFRRYTRRTLAACTPSGARLIDLFALDACGLLASIANKLILHQDLPRPSQIAFWDRSLVPASRVVDPLIGHAIGRSLVAVWQRS